MGEVMADSAAHIQRDPGKRGSGSSAAGGGGVPKRVRRTDNGPQSLEAERRQARERISSLAASERAARQAAADARRSAEKIISSLSHELRTPLQAISGYTELLEEGVHGELTEEQHVAVRRIRAGEHQLLKLINGAIDSAELPEPDSGSR